MAKSKTIFLCQNCGNDFPKWAGQCPACGEWNTLKEMSVSDDEVKRKKSGSESILQSLTDVKLSDDRILSNIGEFDRVLGGGIVPDAFVMLTGDPGVGKSTLALQVALAIAEHKNVMYFSGEESVTQIAGRAQRLLQTELRTQSSELRETKNISKQESLVIPKSFALTSETSLENIFTTIEKRDVDFIVIDSIQTLTSDEIPGVAGSASQVKYCAEALMQFLKKKGIACLLIGHVTKSGEFSGPQTLAHLVDVVLYLEGDRYHQFRMLRGQKNRFGTTSEIGVFEMEGNGLKEVSNPSKAFLEGRLENAEGSVIIPIVEGTRPFLVELQALTSWTSFGYPKRTASGIDMNRLHLMLAVLQKHGNQKMESLDVFINVVGGCKIDEPAADLGLLMAIASSKLKKTLPNDLIIIGEVGLSGEIRSVSHLEKRLKEAEKMGFTQAIIPSSQKIESKIKLIPVKTIAAALKMLEK